MQGWRRYPWHVWVTGIVLLGFGAYCIWVVVSVRTIRERLQDNVATLGTLQALQTAAADKPPRWDDVRDEAADLPPAVAQVGDLANRVRAGNATLDALVGAVDESMRAVRADSSRIARELWQRWRALNLVIGGAVLLGAANLVLLVVARRRRRRAELSEQALAEHHATLAQTATRLAEGDLRTPVVASGERYDRFEAALEGMRRTLVDHISALEDRNRRVEQLAEDLRQQIRASSEQLEIAAVQELVKKDLLVQGAVFAEQYRVVAPIGSGAASDVYEVEHTDDGRTFALKLMRAMRHPQDKARFAREAQILAELHHEDIVGIHRVGVSPAGSPFLVLDLVRGEDLGRSKARHGDVAWLVPVLARVARALAAVHAHGIVHRDVKPGNIVVDDGTPPQVKLVDFGIAHTHARDELPASDGEAEADGSLVFATQIGHVLGTPMYMAPELGNGAAATAASDVFAFGVTAYTVLAGRRPFQLPPVDLAQCGAVARPAPLATQCAGIDVRVASLVERCMSFDPESRPSAAEVAAGLAEITDATTATATAARD